MHIHAQSMADQIVPSLVMCVVRESCAANAVPVHQEYNAFGQPRPRALAPKIVVFLLSFVSLLSPFLEAFAALVASLAPLCASLALLRVFFQVVFLSRCLPPPPPETSSRSSLRPLQKITK